MKKVIHSDNAPKAVGPYSQAIEVGGVLYISGQLPVNPATGLVPDTIEAQTAQCLENVGAILREAGCDYSNVVKSTVLLDDMGDFGKMNEVYVQYYTTDMPARVCYEVSRLPLGAKVEIETIAYK
ncbi:MAG: RidA family protein [Rikenellaceae bacterium]|nr:RidA family protein [Rikenellaceae bacterium]MCL2692280.1 RidA family protein [Rikenellaceae bacterium]